jgi:hypothetical protein
MIELTDEQVSILKQEYPVRVSVAELGGDISFVGDVDQRLAEECHQKGVAPFFRQPLQGLPCGSPSDLGQALEPVGAQAVEQGLGVVGQEGSHDATGLVLGLLLSGNHHPFQAGQPRPHDLVSTQLFTGELEK